MMKSTLLAALRTVTDVQLAAVALQLAEKHPEDFANILANELGIDAVKIPLLQEDTRLPIEFVPGNLPGSREQPRFAIVKVFSRGMKEPAFYRIAIVHYDEAVRELQDSRKKVDVIKFIRNEYCLTLLEAKNIVEVIMEQTCGTRNHDSD